METRHILFDLDNTLYPRECGLFHLIEERIKDYLAFVHEVDVEGVLDEDSGLARMMSRIPLTKVIVTNGTERHAQRVICALGIEPFFSHIFDIAFMGYCPKPNLSTFHRVLDHLGVTGQECLMLDDHLPTLAAARALGMITVYVGDSDQGEADYQIKEIKGLEKVLSDLLLFDAGGVVQ
ncbi:MAG: HAD-IA family hydrolase [Desulfobacterales bacterium]|nr:HAD-IA family hydrolase [Desulfobacterales bacterium]